MREIDIKLEQLAKKLLRNEITPEEHVERYNKLIREDQRDIIYGWRPHEHI